MIDLNFNNPTVPPLPLNYFNLNGLFDSIGLLIYQSPIVVAAGTVDTGTINIDLTTLVGAPPNLANAKAVEIHGDLLVAKGVSQRMGTSYIYINGKILQKQDADIATGGVRGSGNFTNTRMFLPISGATISYRSIINANDTGLMRNTILLTGYFV